ncbi:MAG: pyridoxal-phosphate dependent enzyme [Alphaproteobacteria bacterium]
MESGAGLGAGLVTASGGNHGVAVAYAASVTKTRATVFLGKNVPPARVEKLRDWGAEVIVTGADWNESNEAALDFVAKSGAHYIHPFADPDVIAGQGTLACSLRSKRKRNP